ncbi:MAG: hypothetical protein ACR2LH_07580 [Thermoleophilaceae bacterium]
MGRGLLAFLVGVVVLIPLVIVAESIGIGSWGMTGIGFAVMLLISLIDREGFYGPPGDSQ